MGEGFAGENIIDRVMKKLPRNPTVIPTGAKNLVF